VSQFSWGLRSRSARPPWRRRRIGILLGPDAGINIVAIDPAAEGLGFHVEQRTDLLAMFGAALARFETHPTPNRSVGYTGERGLRQLGGTMVKAKPAARGGRQRAPVVSATAKLPASRATRKPTPRVSAPQTGTAPARLPFAQERTEFLISAIGSGTALADVLGVARSQPTRWRQGQESPSPETARELIDLDHVMARALMLFPQPVALDWLTSANSYLDDARPIDVLRTRGSAEVIDALDATMAGAFA
jgi:uncharacterized protein (DUF2384 family)